MMTRTFTLFFLALLLLATGLAGCSPPLSESPTFGNAVRHNIAVQSINPSPTYAANQPITHSGARQATAVGRYDVGAATESTAPQATEVVTPMTAQ